VAVFKFRNLKTAQAMPIPEGEFVVGRTSTAYVHVDDPSVSRNHARLLNNEEGFFVEDLGSSNGTAMRGALITTRTPISYGNIVHIGSVPFRVDPEVAGEVETKPPPSARNVNPASMRRDTERLPASDEAPWVPKDIPDDQLAAPEVSAADSDAEDLNAVTLRDPDPAAPATPPWPPAETNRPEPAPAVPVPTRMAASISSPTLQRSVIATFPTQPKARKEGGDSPLREPDLRSVPGNLDPGHSGASQRATGRLWHILIFFAGLGVGLLLGLIFAKIFFEMGGKPNGLP
jgi:predicted component of type VI protein secretion system